MNIKQKSFYLLGLLTILFTGVVLQSHTANAEPYSVNTFCYKNYKYDPDVDSSNNSALYDKQKGCVVGYDYNKCDDTFLFVTYDKETQGLGPFDYTADEKTRMRESCKVGLSERKKADASGTLLKEDCSGSKPNPGLCRKACVALGGMFFLTPSWNSSECNIVLPEGADANEANATCNEYGGEWQISRVTCHITNTSSAGEGETCGSFGCDDPASKVCDKYTVKAQNDACQKGYLASNSKVCESYKIDARKKACEFGASGAPKKENTEGDLVDGCNQTTVIKVDCSSGENAIWGILLVIINVLSAGVILVAIGGFVFAAILYSSAADNAGQVSKAKDIIMNIVIGLVCYALMWSFLQFLIPGGIFK